MNAEELTKKIEAKRSEVAFWTRRVETSPTRWNQNELRWRVQKLDQLEFELKLLNEKSQ
ncbi:MAG: hypothetical protein QM762_12470 [Chryseolinea sp.]